VAAFAPVLRQHLDVPHLKAVWAYTRRQVGRLEGYGEAMGQQRGDLRAIDVRLQFEAGERIGRVVFDRDGAVVGLFLRPPALWADW
jgi:uncharacterized SAM-dependent methyltransferase